MFAPVGLMIGWPLYVLTVFLVGLSVPSSPGPASEPPAPDQSSLYTFSVWLCAGSSAMVSWCWSFPPVSCRL